VFRDQMDVDYFGTLHAIRAVVPSMIERRRGHLVTVSSTAGLIGVYGYSAYAPAKFAVRGLTETLRAELAPHGIVVSCVYPPDTRTPGFDAENALKPPETERISAAIKPRDADHVGGPSSTGIEKDRLVTHGRRADRPRSPAPPASSAPTCAARWTRRSGRSARPTASRADPPIARLRQLTAYFAAK